MAEKISLEQLGEMSIGYLFNPLDKHELKREAILLFKRFLEESNATILDNSNVDCNKIVADYFSNVPPFEVNELKKHEFPDAIMAEKLKTMFSSENPIFVVSGDSGFRHAFDNQDGFTVTESLKEIFDLINKQTQLYTEITNYLLNNEAHIIICTRLFNELDNRELYVDGLDCDRKGYAEGHDYEEVMINDISQVDFHLCSVDDINGDMISLTINCEALISATCSYFDSDNSIWDSEEKDYIISTWETVEEVHKPTFDCEITFLVTHNNENLQFELQTVDFDLTLDQWSRVSRTYLEQDDPADWVKADEMETQEEYYKH